MTTSKKERIGFIGLGHLGHAVAMNLLKAGYPLAVYNRTQEKADDLVTNGAVRAMQPLDVVESGGIVVTLLWDDASVESVITSEGFLKRLAPGGVHISMTTISPEMSRKLASLHAAHDSHFVEAPIFGRPEAAAEQKLWIPYVGSPKGKERARPLLKDMGAQGIYDFGEQHGCASTVKLVGNFLMGSAIRSLTEGAMMAEKNGVDPKALIEMLTTTLFSAPVYQNYGKLIANKTVGLSQSPIIIKDLGLFKKTAEDAGVGAPVASLLLGLARGQS